MSINRSLFFTKLVIVMKKVRFYLNKNLDKQMIKEFLNVQAGGIDFGNGIMETHPKLRPVKLLATKQKNRVLHFH